jgi:hypothetical protein
VTGIFRHPWGWASLAPILCAVHCVATPVVVAAAPAFAPGPAAEWALLGLTVALGLAAFATGMRAHGDLRPFIPVAVGLLAWTGSLMYLYRPVPEEVTTVLASLTVAAGLIWNSRLHCAARPVPCSACRREMEEGAALAVTDEEVKAPVEAG